MYFAIENSIGVYTTLRIHHWLFLHRRGDVIVDLYIFESRAPQGRMSGEFAKTALGPVSSRVFSLIGFLKFFMLLRSRTTYREVQGAVTPRGGIGDNHRFGFTREDMHPNKTAVSRTTAFFPQKFLRRRRQE